jgi:ketosteroid isomerase-like protein
MSQENVDTFLDLVSAFNSRDLDAYLELMDPDVEAVPLLAGVEGRYRGHAGVRRWWDSLFDAFPDFAVEVDEVRDLGDPTLAAVRYRAHAAKSDTPVESQLWMAGRWRGGKCVWWGTFASEADAAAAAGLSDEH